MNGDEKLHSFMSEKVTFIEDIKVLIPRYIVNIRKDSLRLTTAVDMGDISEVKKVVHKVKGTARSYGFDAIDLLMDNIDLALQANDFNKVKEYEKYFSDYIDKIDEELKLED